MISFRWVWFIAKRYIFRKEKKSPVPVLSVLGIATGVFALVVIISVMNGFQLGFIESILEISSYHVRVGSLSDKNIDNIRNTVLAVPEVQAAVPFQEFHGLVRGRRGGQQAAIVRGVPSDACALDPGMAGRLVFESGSFNLDDERGALVGAELARRMGIRTGDEINLFSIPSMFNAIDHESEAGSRIFTVTGIFRTGSFEYDTAWVFVNIASSAAFSDTGPVLGVKLKNRFNDYRARELIRKKLSEQPDKESLIDGEPVLSTWRDYNRSFFGALRTEKLFMFILVGLIFIVVGLNIYQSQRRSVLEHREEIGLLRAIGGGERAVRLIFVCDGAIIGFSGASAGLIVGLLTASHISPFFAFMETAVNCGINIVNTIAGFFGAGGVGDFAFFSPAVFYLKEIPSRIIPHEAVLIFMFGFLSALIAAWFASRKVSRIHPAEVLRYE